MDRRIARLIVALTVGLVLLVVPVRAERPLPPGWPADAQSTTGPVPPPGIERGELSAPSTRAEVVLLDVPAYIWHHGCGPTAAGMVVGYWDGNGFGNLVTGSADTQTTEVDAMMSSTGNYDDYCLPIDSPPDLLPDKSEPPLGDEHADDCVADLMKTSQSYHSNYYGWSWYSHVDDALQGYVQLVAPEYSASALNQTWGTFTWDSYRAEIDAGRPVVLLVDTDGNGGTDHFVTAIGYSDESGTNMYACRNTWDTGVHWFEFAQMTSGQPWGIYGATLFQISSGVGPVVYDLYTADDDDSGNSIGNGNGIVECGETIELYVSLHNQGGDTATAVNATISTTDSYVTWLYNTSSSYPDLPGGGSGTNTDDFDFEVDPTTPNGHVIHFDLDVTASSGGPWSDSFDVPVVCTGAQAEWTFLVYLDGDNNLEGAGIEDFLEMSGAGSSSDVNVAVQFDRVSGYDSSYGDWTDTRRFYVTSGMEPWDYNGASIGEANMGDPQTLVDFVQWGMASYPADHYAVVVWDHGSGWRRRLATEPPVKGIAVDDTSGGDRLEMPELRSAMDTLSNGGADPLDLVGLDACLMAMIEVDGQLIPYVDVRVGSEEVEPGDGWPYDAILSALSGNPAMPASQLGTVIVDEYYASYSNDMTQSAVDLGSSYGALNTAVNDFAVALIGGVGSHYSDIASARGSTQEFDDQLYSPDTYVDLYDFADQINLHVSDATINAAATVVMNAVNNAVIRDQHGSSWPGARGISIYFPESESDYESHYDGSYGWLQFTANTQWDEWLHAFYDNIVCNDPHEPNDAPGEATPISYDTVLSDPDICPAGDVDYYSFSGNAGDTIVADIDAQVIGSSLDSYLHLYDTDGVTELAQNDDYDGLDSRITYVLPADGTYYLRVREYNHPTEGGPDYFYTLSLSLETAPSFDLGAGWATSAPSVDGHITPGEWEEAFAYNITVSAPGAGSLRGLDVEAQYDVRAPDLGSRQESPAPRAPLSSVTLYVMNDGSHLYLAFDNPNDTVYHDYDQVGIYFDDNPLPSDGQWTHTTCGHADGEGNFWVRPPTHKFREIIAGPGYCDAVEPAPGVDGTLQFTSGHAQAEVAIDLTSSALRASPGDAIGMHLWIMDYDTGLQDGSWPAGVVWNDPSTYRYLALATEAPLLDDMESGVDGWVATGFWHKVAQGASLYSEVHSPTHSWWYGQDTRGDYDDGAQNSGDLTSPPLYIPGAGYALQFWYWYETEDTGTDWDRKWVQISTDGSSFADVVQISGEPTQSWARGPAIDLSAYANDTIQVRFHFDTVDSVANNYRGWYIDDFSISTNTWPELAGLPDQLFDHSISPPGTIDLWAYASDGETPASGLAYAIEGAPSTGAGVTLDSNQYVTVNPSPNWCGGTDVTVRATDPDGWWDEDTFRVAVSWSCPGPVTMPGAPVLIAPVDGRASYGDAPTFAWHTVGGAEAYQVQVDDVDEGHPADFARPELDETLAGTEFVPSAGLSAGTYTWRVRAVNGAELGAWSPGWTFTVPTSSPGGVKIYLPVVARECP